MLMQNYIFLHFFQRRKNYQYKFEYYLIIHFHELRTDTFLHIIVSQFFCHQSYLVVKINYKDFYIHQIIYFCITQYLNV